MRLVNEYSKLDDWAREFTQKFFVYFEAIIKSKKPTIRKGSNKWDLIWTHI